MRNSDWSSDVCSADLPSAVSARKCGWTEPCETKHWRKRWDSNPRTGCPVAGFQDRFLKQLGHSSMPFRGWQLTTGLWVKTPGDTELRRYEETQVRNALCRQCSTRGTPYQ